MAGNFKSRADFAELEKFSQDMHPTLQQSQQIIVDRIEASEKECFNKNQKNENKYLDCMKQLTKSAEQQSKRLEFSLLYWKHKTLECFQQQAADDRNFTQCKEQQATQLKQIFESYKL